MNNFAYQTEHKKYIRTENNNIGITYTINNHTTILMMMMMIAKITTACEDGEHDAW